MEIQYYGANCIKLSTKKATVVIDDNIKELGGTAVAKNSDITLSTTRLKSNKSNDAIRIDGPGEFEVSDVSVIGVGARAHMDEEGKSNATIYKVDADDLRIAIVGHIYPKLSEKQLEEIGVVDILIIPVGGHGFTLDTVGAQQVIKMIEPKIIIPTYYNDPKLNYPVPAISLEEAIKALAMEPKETVAKLKIKSADLLSDQPQLIILEKQ